MSKDIEGLAELVSEGLDRLSRKDLVENLKEAISLLVKKHIEIEKDSKKSILSYLISHYCNGKAVIKVSDLQMAMHGYKDISIEHEIGKDTIEVILIKESDN